MFEPKIQTRLRLLIRLTIVAMLPALLSAAKPTSIAMEPVSRMTTPWWRQRFEDKQAEIKRRQVDLLWLGDSITQNWELDGPETWRRFRSSWQKFYGDRHAINLGFRGDSTCHLLWRLQHGELEGISPKAAILLIGANNFGHVHTNADQTYDGIVLIIETLHSRLPAMKLLLIGVLPSIRSSWVDINTKLLNRRLATLPAKEGAWIHYIDVTSLFEDHGHVDPHRYLDPLLTPPEPPLHPVADAQVTLAKTIEPLVAAMMGNHMHR